MYLPGYPSNIVQRGNDREVCFIDPDDNQYYRELWKDYSERYGIAVYTCCLMTNHIHFLVSSD